MQRSMDDPTPIAAATLTGSNRAGRTLPRSAGEQLKKSRARARRRDPFIVLDDADFEVGVRRRSHARFQHRAVVHRAPSGSSCTSDCATIRSRSPRPTRSLPVGDPTDRVHESARSPARTSLMNLARSDRRLRRGRAKVLTGGEYSTGPARYAPTVLVERHARHARHFRGDLRPRGGGDRVHAR